jgi:DNA polymerase-3 subunit epsilon
MTQQAGSQRQILLDTETTGLEVDQGHRIIEIGCVELRNRRLTGNNLQLYFNPDRPSDEAAFKVHGLADAFLATQPRFHEGAQQIWDYLAGAELLIHNASFDMGFLNREFRRCGFPAPLDSICKITDTASIARRLYPGQRVGLDSLCKRLGVDNSSRQFHGALLDAQLLAEVYLHMSGGQSRLSLESDAQSVGQGGAQASALLIKLRLWAEGKDPIRIWATEPELLAHAKRLAGIAKKKKCIWQDPLAPELPPEPQKEDQS